MNAMSDIGQCWADMIIEALVKIELKSDGTWQIVGLKALTETKPIEIGLGKSEPLKKIRGAPGFPIIVVSAVWHIETK